ncbi:MAG TPA: hypothetical protein VFD70_22835 [Anaerolineae bacterium]|nr:hypothetical protein [Anaerolineae bacterium]
MPLLKDQDRQALEQTFGEMPGRVRVIFFTQALDCETCEITGKILDEIAPLGEKIELVKYNFAIDKDKVSQYNIARIPAIAIVRLDESQNESGEPKLHEHDYGIRFYGVPAGYEFMSLVGSILDVSSGDSQLSPQSRGLVAQVQAPTHIQVFTTPT